MNPYRPFVSEIARLRNEASRLPLGGFLYSEHQRRNLDAPHVLLFSPHPDDECIIGALPLRLLKEAGMDVINVAVTQGSNKQRQSERLRELTAACGYLGFNVVQTAPNGLEGVNPKTRSKQPELWEASVRIIEELLRQYQPSAIFFPHVRDWNSTHIGTHHLVMDALPRLGNHFQSYLVETEFWGQMDDPNLMVESSENDVADLIAALSFHVGEVKRNPYHLIVPAWMQDNVRRGCELVGGQGGAAPGFLFATLYRARVWEHGALKPCWETGQFIGAQENPTRWFDRLPKCDSPDLKSTNGALE